MAKAKKKPTRKKKAKTACDITKRRKRLEGGCYS